MLDRRRASGPPFAEIVNIQTVKHRREPFGARELSDTRIHFGFAEVTAIRRVGQIVLVLRFEGAKYHVARADFSR